MFLEGESCRCLHQGSSQDPRRSVPLDSWTSFVKQLSHPAVVPDQQSGRLLGMIPWKPEKGPGAAAIGSSLRLTPQARLLRSAATSWTPLTLPLTKC